MKALMHSLLFTALFLSVTTFGCSASDDTCEDHHFDGIQLASNSHMDLDDYIHWNHGRKTLTFYDDDFWGDQTKWKVVLRDGEIEKLYKDGRRLSASEIEENEDYIYDKLEETEDSMKDLKVDLADLEEELANLDFNFDLDLDFDDDNFSMSMHFDEDAFEDAMEQLSESLSKMNNKKYSYHFDSDDWDMHHDDYKWDKKKFNKEMKQLNRELRKLEDLDMEIEFDMDDFNEGMKELNENLKDLKINMSGFDDEMIKLNIEMDVLKSEMKKLKGFLNEMSAELEWDGYIDDADEEYELELNEDEMIVNGRKLPDRLHEKYLEMYEKHFGKELEHCFSMHTHR